MKHYHIILLALLLFPIVYGLEGTQPTIALYTPQDNATITSQTQEFVFSVEAPEDGKTCKLLINGDEMRSYANVIRRKSSKFTTSLPSDTYTWQISCTLNDNTQLASPERIIKVDIRQTSCVEKVSKGSGSYRYVFTLGCLKKSPVVLTELRVNDWIEFKLTESERVPGGFESRDNYVTFYINKLSKTNNLDFIQMYSSTESEKINLFVGDSAIFDAIGQELNYTLESIATKKAKYTIRLQGYDYLAQMEQNETENTTLSGEEPIDDTTEITDDTTETTIDTTPPEDTGDEVDITSTDETDTYEDVPEDKTKTVITVIIIFILAIIVLYLMLTKNKGKEPMAEKPGKKEQKKNLSVKKPAEKKGPKKKAGKEDASAEIKEAVKEEKPKKKRDFEKERAAFIIEGPHK
ncbi:MAG: hypothetical protein ABIJ21_09200 [Nanoarchaeota archaeon]